MSFLISHNTTLRWLTALLIAWAVTSQSAFAVSTETQTVEELMFAKLLSAENVSKNALESGTLWSEEKGKHIYLTLLNDNTDRTFKQAISTISNDVAFKHQKTGAEVYFSEEEWRKMYINNQYATVFERRLGITNAPTVNELGARLREIVEQEIENNRFAQELTQMTSSTELFSDGNVNNSAGFDLLTDLEKIETILFGKVEAGSYGEARASAGLPALPSINTGELPASSSATEGATPSTTSTTASSSSSPSPSTSTYSSTVARRTLSTPRLIKAPANQSFADDKKEFPTGPSTAESLYNPLGLHPEQCDSPSALTDAITDYLDTLETAEKEKFVPDFDVLTDEKTDERTGTRDTPTSGGDDTESGTGTGGDTVPEDTVDDSRSEFDDVPEAEKFDWQNEELCVGPEGQPKIFCLEVRFINNNQECEWGADSGENSCANITTSNQAATSGTYEATDNCVSCHIEFMLANFDLLLAKTLSPSKVPGNLLESGKCKKSFLKVKPSLNLFAVKKPIPQPPDDYQIFQTSNPFESFLSELTDGFTSNKRTDRNTRHIVRFGDGKSLPSVLDEIDKADSAYAEELALNRQLALIEQEVEAQVNGYDDITGRMEEFNSLISALDGMATDINTNVCEALRSKKVCE